MNKLLSFVPENTDCDFKRIEIAGTKMFNRKATVCYERAEIYTKSFKETEDLPMILRKAIAFKKAMEEMSIYIEEGMLIVGNQASRNFAAPIFPEYSYEWVIDELDEFHKRSGDSFDIDEDTKEKLRSIKDYWIGNTHQDVVLKNLSPVNREAEEQGVLHRGGISMSGDGHIIPNYEFVFEHGFTGLKNIALDKLKNNQNTQDQIDYYNAVVITMEGASIYCARFSKLAQLEAKSSTNLQRRNELNQISSLMLELSSGKPTSFHAAVELVYLVHLLMMIESNGHSFSFGRFDQYTNDFYIKDIEQGIMTKEKALEIITHFYIMTNSLNKIRPWGHTQYSGGYPLYSNLILGGVNAEGEDCTNDLSYLCLEAMALTGLPEPNLSVRINDNTPKQLINDSSKLIRRGFGMPSVFYDNVVIPAMMSLGIEESVARDYASMGCVETAIPGRWGHRATGMTYVNFGKILELVLYNGYDPATGIQLKSINGQQGTEIEYKDFDEMFAAWETLLKYYSDLAIDCDIVCDQSLKVFDADPFASSTINNSLELGKTLKEGGSEYDYVSSSNIGPSVVGDSFAAIKKLIFEEQRMTFKDLREVLSSNFEGLEGAKVRKLCRNAPKFGNDDDYVDYIVADVFESYLKLLPTFKTDRFGKGPIGCGYTMSTSNITSYVPNGFDVGATPDGRLATMPLNEGASPCLGADRSGPTAVINSISKLPNKKIAGGQLLNMRFTPGALEGDDNLMKFSSFLEACGQKNIFHNQFNIVDSSTLKAAKENPEDYPDLMVRVAGYCALFSTLMPEAQDAIIARTEMSW